MTNEEFTRCTLHYCRDCRSVKDTPTTSINNTPNTTTLSTNTTVELINPNIKNKYHIAPNGAYENFIVKYSNYTSNKKHCIYNFNYFVENTILDGYNIINNTSNKIDDVADAFMMIYGYLKEKDML